MSVRILTVFAILVLGACVARPGLVLDESAGQIGSIRSVFVATSRAQDEDGSFRSARSPDLSFMRIDVSVPPAHALGEIEYPKGTPDASRHFLAAGVERQGSASGFRQALSQSLRNLPPSEREVAIFIHGFNNTLTDGVFRSAQLAHDFELSGLAVHYSWPSAENPLGYGYDRDSMLFARDGFEDLLQLVQDAGARRVLIIAHSLGGLLTMETMRQMSFNQDVRSVVDGVFLISPDIDVEVFRAQAERIGNLPQPFLIFVSQKDRALRLSARLTGQRDRLGTLSNPEEVADLDVTIFDVTVFSEGGLNHFVTGNSPLLISLFKRLGDLNSPFLDDPGGRTGLLPGTVLTVQNATQIILAQPGN